MDSGFAILPKSIKQWSDDHPQNHHCYYYYIVYNIFSKLLKHCDLFLRQCSPQTDCLTILQHQYSQHQTMQWYRDTDSAEYCVYTRQLIWYNCHSARRRSSQIWELIIYCVVSGSVVIGLIFSYEPDLQREVPISCTDWSTCVLYCCQTDHVRVCLVMITSYQTVLSG